MENIETDYLCYQNINVILHFMCFKNTEKIKLMCIILQPGMLKLISKSILHIAVILLSIDRINARINTIFAI